jgi:hypothetical protein
MMEYLVASEGSPTVTPGMPREATEVVMRVVAELGAVW